MAHDFASLLFHTTHRVPSYQAWLDGIDWRPVYASHRRQLQYLQWRAPAARWVLKSPGHLAVIEDLLEVYPDACIVHTHRDPVEVMPSLPSLSYTLRGMSSDVVDPRLVGRQQASLWSEHLRRAMRARDRAPDPQQFFASMLPRKPPLA